MKKTWILFAALVLATALHAQDTTSKKEEITQKEAKSKSDFVIMKDGKMMVQKGDKVSALKKSIALENGTLIGTDGSVKLKTGESMTLKEGQGFYMDGKMKM